MSNTPQPNVDDRMLAETLYEIAEDASLTKIKLLIAEVTTPLRLSNEALRERVKQLEGVLMVQNDKVCIHHNDAERVKIFDGCPICKLSAANERVKELEKLMDMILSSEGKGLLLALKEHQLKLAAASEVIEKCERPVGHLAAKLSCHCFTGADQTHKDWCEIKYAQQALAAIKEWKQQNPTPPI